MLKTPKNSKTALALAAVLVLGLVLGAAILRSGHAPHAEDGHDHAPAPTQAPDAGPEHAEGRVRMDDATLGRHGIEIATAGPARIRTQLQLMGEVRLNQDRSVFVTPRLAGLVEAVHVNAGDRVQRGQVLAVLTSQALADQRAELLALHKRLALARTTLEREQRLWAEKISAEQDYLAARQAHQELEIATEAARQKLAALGAPEGTGTQGLARYEVRAPIAGVVIDRKLSVGEVLKDDTAIFQLADLGSVWVEFAVPARDLHALKPGDTATVQAAAASATARVSHVGALLGEQSRHATARLLLPNPQGQWRPGLPVTVALTAEEVAVPLAVRAEALQTLDSGPVVFGRDGPHFQARPVTTGRSDGQHVEILQGLAAGDRYASGNSFLVKAETAKATAGHAH